MTAGTSEFTYDFGIKIAQATVNKLTRLAGATLSLATAYYALKKTAEEYINVAKTNTLFFNGQLSAMNAMVAAQDRLVKGQMLFNPEDQLSGLNKLMTVGVNTSKYMDFVSKSAHALGIEYNTFAGAISSGISGSMSSLVSMGVLTERAVKMFEKYPANTIMRQQAILKFLREHKGIQNAIAQDYDKIEDHTRRLTGVWKTFAFSIVGRPNDSNSLYSGVRGMMKGIADALSRNMEDIKRYGEGIGIFLNWTVKQIGGAVLWIGRQAKKAANFLFGSSENFVERMRKTVVWLEFWKLKVKDFFTEYSSWIKTGIKVLLAYKALRWVFHIGAGAFLTLFRYRRSLLGLLALQRRYALFTGQRGIMTWAALLPRPLRKAWIITGKIVAEFRYFFGRLFREGIKSIGLLFKGIYSGFRFLGRGFLLFSNMLHNFGSLFTATLKSIGLRVTPFFNSLYISLATFFTKSFASLSVATTKAFQGMMAFLSAQMSRIPLLFHSIGKGMTSLVASTSVLLRKFSYSLANVFRDFPVFFSRSLKNFPSVFRQSIRKFPLMLRGVFSAIPVYFATAVSGFGKMFRKAVSGFRNVLIRTFSSLPTIHLKFNAGGLKGFLQNMPIYIGGGFKGLGRGLKGFVKAIPKLFTKQGFSKVWAGFRNIFKPSTMAKAGSQSAKAFGSSFKGVFGKIAQGTGKAFSKATFPIKAVKNLMQGIFSAFKVSNPVGWIITAVMALGSLYLKFEGFRNVIHNIGVTIWNVVKIIWNSLMYVVTLVRIQVKKLFGLIGELWNKFLNTKMGQKLEQAYNWLSKIFGIIGDFFARLFKKTREGTAGLSETIAGANQRLAEEAGLKHTGSIKARTPEQKQAAQERREERKAARKARKEARNGEPDYEDYGDGTIPLPDFYVPEGNYPDMAFPDYSGSEPQDIYSGGGFEHQNGVAVPQQQPNVVVNPIMPTQAPKSQTKETSPSTSITMNDGAVKIIVQKGEGINEELLVRKIKEVFADVQRTSMLRQGRESVVPEYT